jgi:hypothetical protein
LEHFLPLVAGKGLENLGTVRGLDIAQPPGRPGLKNPKFSRHGGPCISV